MAGPRTQLTRDEAALLLGLLITDADGRQLPVEFKALQDRLVAARATLLPDSTAVVKAWEAEARASGPDGVLRRVARALPEPKDRHWAMDLAIRVAYADRHMDAREADHIASLARAIGLTPDEVERLARR